MLRLPAQSKRTLLSGRASGLRFLDQLPDARRREWQLHRLNVEVRQGIRHGIGHDAANRDQTALARSLRAERIVRAWLQLDRNGTDVGEIGCGRHQVVGEGARQQLSSLPANQMLQERATETLNDL